MALALADSHQARRILLSLLFLLLRLGELRPILIHLFERSLCAGRGRLPRR